MMYYVARLNIESQVKEFKTGDNPTKPIRKVSLDIICGDRERAHEAVDAFFDEYDKMVNDKMVKR